MKLTRLACGIFLLLASSTPTFAQDAPRLATAQDTINMLHSQLSKLTDKVNSIELERHYDNVWKRKKYWKFMYGKPSLDRNDELPLSWDCDLSAQVSRGRTGYFHRTPIGGMVKIGMDFGFFDVAYTRYKFKGFCALPDDVPTDWADSDFDDEPLDMDMQKIDYGWHFGPVVSINPWNHLIISLYAHFTPTATCLLENGNYTLGYGLGYSYGASLSYKVISLGVENTWSDGRYKQLQYDDEDHEGQFITERFNLKQKGPRFYLSIRF